MGSACPHVDSSPSIDRVRWTLGRHSPVKVDRGLGAKRTSRAKRDKMSPRDFRDVPEGVEVGWGRRNSKSCLPILSDYSVDDLDSIEQYGQGHKARDE